MIETPKKKIRIGNIIFFLLSAIIIAIMIILLLYVKIYKIGGTSMNPTLVEGDYVICIESKNIKRGDLVAFYNDDDYVIKRVIALPNETIDIKEDGTVYVNDTELKENYITNKSQGNPEILFPYELSTTDYFVLGDNREDSLDSRHHPVGTLTMDEIICKVEFIL